jgi:hypothetical protein
MYSSYNHPPFTQMHSQVDNKKGLGLVTIQQNIESISNRIN